MARASVLQCPGNLLDGGPTSTILNMRTRLFLATLCLGLFSNLWGCGSSDRPPAPPRPQIQPEQPPQATQGSSAGNTSLQPIASPTHRQAALATGQRWILIGDTGPRIIDLFASLDQQSLEASWLESIRGLMGEAGLQLDQEIPWDAVLAAPLISTGWLGNLIAGPEQRDQLLTLYDVDRSGTADLGELSAFLTRGASRGSLIQLVPAPTPPRALHATDWGAIDQDANGEVSLLELQQAPQRLWQVDFDEDRLLTRAELALTETSSDTMSSRRTNLLDIDRVVALTKPTTDQLRRLFEFYSMTDTIPREAWSSWSDQRMASLGTQDPTRVTPQDLLRLDGVAADVNIRLNLHRGSEAVPALWSVEMPSQQVATEPTFPAIARQIRLADCVILLTFEDHHSPSARDNFHRQLSAAGQTTANRDALLAKLNLSSSAWELLSSQPQKTAAATAWHWLTAARDSQLAATWQQSDTPWFDWLDRNADQRLSEAEIGQLPQCAELWDTDGDAVLTSTEIPLAFTLRLTRLNPRTMPAPLGGTASEKGGGTTVLAPSWFQGMDYNSDGLVARAEFFGSDRDFARWDKNRDGIIESREVTTPP